MLFSATLDGDVDHIVKKYLVDPVHHEVESDQPTVDLMEHRFLKVHQMDKVTVAASIIGGADRCLVFVRTKRGADRVSSDLRREGVKVGVIHGDLPQKNRSRAMADFGSGAIRALVATDVAARGLDVKGVDVVLHYDPAEDHKAYLHRSGRTARAGKTGVAVSLVLWDQEREADALQKRLGISQPMVEVFSNDSRLSDLAAWDPAADVAVELAAIEATGTDDAGPPVGLSPSEIVRARRAASPPKSGGSRRRRRML
jgi:superfamily II DNA/RNA helicase